MPAPPEVPGRPGRDRSGGPGSPDDPLDLAAVRRIHVVGIGGAGMSAIATVLRAMGMAVTGSDLKESPVTRRLLGQGIDVRIGHQPANLGPVDLVTCSPAVPESNPEIQEARRRGVPVARRSAVLAAIADRRRTIAVAGTHGKTTTASMLALVLVEAGLRPSFLIGADVNEIGTNAVWDRGEWLVVEADESYGTFGALRPEVAIVTNVEADHLDHYGTFAELRRAFARFVAGARGGAVVWADDPVAAELGQAVGARSVGTDPGSDYRLERISLSRSAVGFELIGPGGTGDRLEVPVPGRHNAANAALAAVAALGVGVPLAVVTRALARFAGVPRRFEFRGEANGVTFVDDYAHLPTEVRATLAAARAGRWARVVAVFQPHRYTRTAALARQFGTAFVDADALVVTDVYGAGETPVPGVSGRSVADAVAEQDPRLPVVYAPSREELRAAVVRLLAPGDLCCTLGAGDLTTLPDELLAVPEW
ncbi:MAG TPA: UDP-N-acetylmuramate--L-alanine ligase [Acidimicrobiales bacterium]